MNIRFRLLFAGFAAFATGAAWAEVLSVNFGSADYAVAENNDPGALVADSNWYNLPGTDGTAVTCGDYSVTVEGTGNWANTGKSAQFLKGYIDENSAGTSIPINITVGGLTVNALYDVIIYCSSDNAQGWSKKTVNGTDYTGGVLYYAAGGETNWGSNGGGSARAAMNAMVVHRVSPNADGQFVIHSERNGDYRGSIAALQIASASAYKAVSGTVKVSTLNTEFTSGTLELALANDVILDMDEAFAADTVILTGTGTATLKADAIPSTTELAKLNVTRYAGVLKRTWGKTASYGINLVSGRGASKDGALAETPWYDVTDANGSKVLSTDGLTKATWISNTVWNDTGSNNTFVRGYLDDGNEGCSLLVTAIPADNYDVIVYCTTDTDGKNLHPCEVNGRSYTWDSTSSETVEGTSGWGQGNQSDTPALGVNALRINNQSGTLFVHLPPISSASRGCLSAVQIVASVTTAEKYVTEGTLKISDINTWAAANDAVKINLADGVTIEADTALATGDTTMSYVAAGSLTVSGAPGRTFEPNSLTMPSTASVSYTGLNALSLPYSYTATPGGKVVVSGTIENTATGAELALGTGSATMADQVFEFDGLDVTVPTVKLGNGKGNQTITQKSGAISVTGTTLDCTSSSALFAHWANTVVYNLEGGSFTSAAAVRFGWDGTINLSVGGGANTATFTAPGLAVGQTPVLENYSRSNGATLTIKPNGIVNLGAFGLPFARSANAQLVMAGGKLVATDSTTISSAKDISVTADSILEVAAGKTVALEGNTAGTGKLMLSLGTDASVSVIAGNESAIATPASGAITVILSDALIAQGYTTQGSFGAGTVVTFVNTSGETQATVTTTEAAPQAVFAKTGANWYGNSNTWSATMFDGEGAAVGAGTVVTFNDNQTSPYEAVTVSVSGAKTVRSMEFLANTTKYTLTGTDGIETVGDVKITGTAATKIDNPLTVGGALNLGTGTALTVKNVSLQDGGLTGSGALTLDPGEGATVTVSAANTGYTGEVTIQSGTVVMGGATAFGPYNRAASIRVKGGATLDTAGKGDTEYPGSKNKAILEDGATLTTSVAYGDNKQATLTGLTLEGNATVVAENNYSIANMFLYTTPHIVLGTNTLTKTGAGDLYLNNSEVTGSGVIDVKAGMLVLIGSQYTSQASYGETTFKLAAGTTLALRDYGTACLPTIKHLVLDGTVTFAETGDRLTISGSLSGSGTLPRVVLASGAVIKPTYAGAITMTGAITGTPKFVLPDMSSGANLVLIKADTAENLPNLTAENIEGGIPQGYALSKTADGLSWRLQKREFIIRLR